MGVSKDADAEESMLRAEYNASPAPEKPSIGRLSRGLVERA